MLLAVPKNGQFEGKFTKRLDLKKNYDYWYFSYFLRQTVAKYVLKNCKVEIINLSRNKPNTAKTKNTLKS